MTDPVAFAQEWLAGSDPRPVVLSSPHPADECLRRLKKVTTKRGPSWYLDPRTAGLPEPRLRGEVGAARILVTRSAMGSRGDGHLPWLDGRLEPDANGGARLTGLAGQWAGAGVRPRAGSRPGKRQVFLALAGVGLLFVATLTGTVTMMLVSPGSLGYWLPFVLGPWAGAAMAVAILASNRWQLQQGIPALVEEVSAILNATVTWGD